MDTEITPDGATAPERGHFRRNVGFIASLIRVHPKPFFIAVGGAAVFAICTIASSFAIGWVIDHVILPRFEEGSVGVSTVQRIKLEAARRLADATACRVG